MHSNPVNKKWTLVTDVAAYGHSSVKFYATGVQGNCEVVHSNDWILKNWV